MPTSVDADGGNPRPEPDPKRLGDAVPAGVARQEWYRQQYRLNCPGWSDSQSIYREIIAQHIGPGTRVVDIGCGHADFLESVYALTPFVYGVDPDPLALARNRTVRHPVVGSAENLPLEAGSFDLATMAWVVEHLEHPERAAQEIHRVLRPGGRLVFLTPNAWNYNAWLVRAVPNRFHHLFTRPLYGRQDRDTYPVRYRMNTPRRVEQVLRDAGFRQVRLVLNGDPSYISFNQPLFRTASLLERWLDRPRLRFAKVHLIGLYER